MRDLTDDTATVVHRARFDDLDRRVLYDLLRLRSDVFVVEQDCVFPELDGRDLETDAEHLWVADDDGAVVACLRLLHEHDGTWSIGRVVARASARSTGVATTVMRAGIERARALGADAVRIGAQAQLRGWYARFGFVQDGDRYLEDGILHVPMVLALDGRGREAS